MKILCPFCGSKRRVNLKRTLGLGDWLKALICALFLMLVFFRGFDGRVFLLFIFLVAVGELFVRLRWRLGLLCAQCGFDPLIYQRSPEKAAVRVRDHLERRKNDPRAAFLPPLNLPVRRVERKNPDRAWAAPSPPPQPKSVPPAPPQTPRAGPLEVAAAPAPAPAPLENH